MLSKSFSVYYFREDERRHSHWDDADFDAATSLAKAKKHAEKRILTQNRHGDYRWRAEIYAKDEHSIRRSLEGRQMIGGFKWVRATNTRKGVK